MADSDGTAQIINLPVPGRRFAEFRAIFKKMSVDRMGNLHLTFVVPMDSKYDALPVTDHPGMLLRIRAVREVIVYSDKIIEELKRFGVTEFADRDAFDRDEFEGDED